MKSGTPRKEVIFKITYWGREEEEGKIIIHIAGITEDGKTVFVKVLNFEPHIYLELPLASKINWSKKNNQILLTDFLNKKLGEKNQQKSTKIIPMNPYIVYYKRRIAALKITFPSMTSIYGLIRIFNRKIYIPGLGQFSGSDFKVHEQNIDVLLKFATSRNIEMSNWIKVKEIKRHEDDEFQSGFSSCNIDLYANWIDIDPYKQTKTISLNLKYCSFDIECYSTNHNSKLPEPELPGNVIFQIGMTFGKIGRKERDKKILTLYDPLESEGITTLRYESEADLLIGFRDVVLQESPDIFIGYNIVKFDWNYMIVRADLLGIYNQFAKMSKLIGVKARLDEKKWASSAYGDQQFKMLDCHGISILDVMVEVQRNYKLSSYSLNNVSSKFLGTKKDPVSARQMFLLYQVTIDTWNMVKNYIIPYSQFSQNNSSRSLKVSKDEHIKIKNKILSILTQQNSKEILKDYRDEVLDSNTHNIIDVARKAIQIILKYCVKDTMLPIDLCDRLTLVPTLEEMSNVTCVPTSYLQTRGQQIKVLAQIYRSVQKDKIIIPYSARKDGDEEAYEGAIVFKAIKGLHYDVSVLDFASLYPTIMISCNLCYTTIVADNDPIPDSECHIMEWGVHKGCNCPLDKKDKKIKAGEEKCESHRKRFRRVQYEVHDDGTIIRKYEGVLPRLLRNLLSSRKSAKKEMFKVDSKIKMHEGTATSKDIELYEKIGWNIIEKGSLSDKEIAETKVQNNVLNAKQLALKISANSVYGFVGATKGYLPQKSIAASVTSEGRFLITSAAEYIEKIEPSASLVYGDTDSCMFKFEGKSLKESFALAKVCAAKATHYLKCNIIDTNIDYKIRLDDGSEFLIDELTKFRYNKDGTDKFNLITKNSDKILFLKYGDNPIDLEFENMYGEFLMLTKKRYIAHVINENGKIESTTKKGVVEARRDNCNFLRESYKQICEKIFDGTEDEVTRVLYTRINNLFTGQIPDEDFVIYMGVKSLMEYARNCKEEKKGLESIKVYFDKNDKIFEPVGWDDPRLEYPNLPQAMLAKKMMERGEVIPPNSRLEYLYLENNKAIHQGEKAEDYTYFVENKETKKFKVDYNHYLEKQFTKPVEELIRVRFPKEIIPYEEIKCKYDRLYEKSEPRHLQIIAKLRHFSKVIYPENKLVFNCGEIVGWELFREFGVHDYLIPAKKIHKETRYVTKAKKDVKIEYILHSSKISKPNEIDPDIHSELVETCKKIKACNILHKLYKKFNLRKRPGIRPTRTGPILSENTKITFVSGKYKGRLGLITYVKDLNPPEPDSKKKKRLANDFLYTISIDDGSIICKHVKREEITTYHIRDKNLMKDILDSRQFYNQVVEEFKSLVN